MRVAVCVGVTFQLTPWLEFVITINGEAAQCLVNVLFVVDLCISVTSVPRIQMCNQNGTLSSLLKTYNSRQCEQNKGRPGFQHCMIFWWKKRYQGKSKLWIAYEFWQQTIKKDADKCWFELLLKFLSEEQRTFSKS